jgi:hypothetical protein
VDNLAAGFRTAYYGAPKRTVTHAAASGLLQYGGIPKEYADPAADVGEFVTSAGGIYKAGQVVKGLQAASQLSAGAAEAAVETSAAEASAAETAGETLSNKATVGAHGPDTSTGRWAWRPSREQPLPPRPGGSAPSGDIGELRMHIQSIRGQGASIAEAEQAWNEGMGLIKQRAAAFPGNLPVENNFYGVVGGEWRVYIGRPPVPGADTTAIAFNSRMGAIMEGLESGIRPHPAIPNQKALFNFRLVYPQ